MLALELHHLSVSFFCTFSLSIRRYWFNVKNNFRDLSTEKSDIRKIRQESKTPQAKNHKQKTFLVISLKKKNFWTISFFFIRFIFFFLICKNTIQNRKFSLLTRICEIRKKRKNSKIHFFNKICEMENYLPE